MWFGFSIFIMYVYIYSRLSVRLLSYLTHGVISQKFIIACLFLKKKLLMYDRKSECLHNWNKKSDFDFTFKDLHIAVKV